MPSTRLLLSAAIGLLNTAVGLPSPTSDLAGFAKRADNNILAPMTVGIYLCTDVDWKGQCIHLIDGTALCRKYPPHSTRILGAV